MTSASVPPATGPFIAASCAAASSTAASSTPTVLPKAAHPTAPTPAAAAATTVPPAAIRLVVEHASCRVPQHTTDVHAPHYDGANALRRFWLWLPGKRHVEHGEASAKSAGAEANAAAEANAVAEANADDRATIFCDLSFELHAGQIVDFIGPSGSGKSTLLTAIARLNPYAVAEMTLDGEDVVSMTPERWRRLVAYVPQRPTLIGDTVREAIMMPYRLRVHQRTDDDSTSERRPSEATLRRTLDEVGCGDIELDRPPQELSVGQQARVCLLRTLLTDPKVLLADEVDAGLDDENADKVGEMLAHAAGRNMAIMRVRHRAADGRAYRTLRLRDGVLSEVTLTREAQRGNSDKPSPEPAHAQASQFSQISQTAQTTQASHNAQEGEDTR
ncbi:ABC transporter ATP-binding protein [Bifidobacterium subtile]|uniref:ABC transporter ATP-binding protein n=1 Tax=Bifidobacterium subtile TaxID=77635 RepID=A0A087EBN4_9BIFI|nr:ABC transporter ATP-binding protein [Bifidobacterium subtile]QOL36586.1 ATP-binding cassette domain-containing protein [Bifidobacterium subtile]